MLKDELLPEVLVFTGMPLTFAIRETFILLFGNVITPFKQEVLQTAGPMYFCFETCLKWKYSHFETVQSPV